MSDFRAERMVRTHHFELPVAPGEALQYFTPEGERAWAAGWEPRYLHPADGRTTAGMVFTTGHGGEETLWTMTRHEPEAGLVEYLRVTPGSRMGSVRVQCSEAAHGTCVTVTYALTALTPGGNDTLRALDACAYEAFIASWRSAIVGATHAIRSATTT
jgi:hypothetical protein